MFIDAVLLGSMVVDTEYDECEIASATDNPQHKQLV